MRMAMTFRHKLPARMRSRLFPLIGFGLAALLQGCGGGSSSLPTYDLSAATISSERPLKVELAVREPLGPIELDTQRIVVRTDQKTLAYLPDGQWSDRLPALVQTRLVQTFQNAKVFRSVSRVGGAPADYALALDIRHFEVDAPSGKAMVEIAAEIDRDKDGRIVAAKVFKSEAPVAGVTGPQAAAALDKALAVVMGQIVSFTATRL
jgi:cholesterol transport system auxiliary component